MRTHFLFRHILFAFSLVQICLFPGQIMARTPDPLILPAGEIRAVLSAEAVNQELIDQGRATPTTLPFTTGTLVYEIRTSKELLLVRTYLKNPSRLKDGAVGSWLMSPTSLRGISPVQVKDFFALPALNDYLTTVRVPAGTVLRTGSAGPISGWGDGGGQQILLIARIPVENFERQRTLVGQNFLFFPLAPSGNPGRAAAYLDRLPAAEPFSDWNLVNLLMGYLEPGPLQQVLTQIGPERYDTLTQLDILNVLLFADALEDRLENRRRTFLPGVVPSSPLTGNETPASFELNQDGLGLWGQVAGVFGRQDGSRDHVGFQYQGGGLMAGVDKRIHENLLLGGGFSLSRTGFSWSDGLGDGNISRVNLGLYGSLLNKPFIMEGALFGGLRKAEVSRRIYFPGVDRQAASSPNGYNLAARLNSGLQKKFGCWNLQPMVRMDLIYVTQDALSESGAESLNLKVDGYNTWTWRGEVGLRLAGDFALPSGIKIIPDLWFGGGYQVPLDNRELKAALSSQPGSLKVNGYNNSTGAFLTRLGLAVKGWGRSTFFLRYAGELRPDFLGHALSAGLQVPF